MTLSRRLVYPLCLLAGSLLAVVAGALHPDIAGQDGPSQLATIAQSPAWPAIHWAFLFSFPLALTGLVCVIRPHAGTADAGLTATRAVFVFDMLRPFALDAQRVGGFALGLATALFGWGVLDGKVLPRWLGAAALAAGGVGIVLALVFREDTKADQAAFVLPVVWQLVTGVVMLRRA